MNPLLGSVLLAFLAGFQAVPPALDKDPRTLPHAQPGHWSDFDPAKLRKGELPQGMSAVLEALQGSDYVRALSALQRVLVETPDFPPAWHQLGVLYFRLQRYGDAAVCFERYLQAIPSRVGDTRVLAHCYYSLGDYTKARAHYERVLERNPDEVEALRGHALACMRLGELDGALAELERVLVLAPEHSEAWMWKAQILFDLDRPEPALKAGERARELDPFEPRVWFLLGRIYIDLGRGPESETAIRRFKELGAIHQEIRSVENRLLYRPGDHGLLRQLAELHRSSGNVAKVREALAQLFAAFSESVEVRVFGLDLLESLGDFEAGRLVARKLEGLGAEDAAVWKRLEAFHAHAKDRVKQLEAGERFRRLTAR